MPDSFKGVERVIWSIAQATHAFGVETHVLSLSQAPHSGPLLVDTHFVHHAKLDLYLASTGFSVSVFKQFEQLSRTVDLVHYHFPWPMMDVLHLLKSPRTPTLVTYHSDVVKQQRLMWAYRPVMRSFLDRVDHIVATSPNYLATSETLQRYRNKTSVIPIGIDETRPVVSNALIEFWRERVGRDFFLFLGAPRYYKGLSYMIEASRLSKSRVVIAGATPSAINGLTKADKGRIEVVGEVTDDDKEALLALCRAFVFPSHLRSEAFGVALLEASRAGKPMITCEIGTGTSFVNLDGETGIIVPPANASALAAAMRKLSEHPDLAQQLGGGAAQRFAHEFGSRRMGERYFSLYRELISQHRLES